MPGKGRDTQLSARRLLEKCLASLVVRQTKAMDRWRRLPAHLKKKEAKNLDLHPRKSLAEVHGNRTHPPPSADGTPDLKSGGPTRNQALPEVNLTFFPPGMGAVFSRNKVKIIPTNFQGRAACRRGPVPALGCGHSIYFGPWPRWLAGGRSFSSRPGQKILTFALQLVYS